MIYEFKCDKCNKEYKEDECTIWKHSWTQNSNGTFSMTCCVIAKWVCDCGEVFFLDTSKLTPKDEIEKTAEQCKSLTGIKPNHVKMNVKTLIELKQQERQKTFDIMKANSTCKYEGNLLRRCYAKEQQILVQDFETEEAKVDWQIVEIVESLECCLERCPLFNGGGM